MSHAELCPVCGGSGEVWRSDPNTSSVGYYTTCHGCGGCGWVIVPDSMPYTPSWSPWNPYDNEWWYTSDGMIVRVKTRIKIEENPENPVDCGGNHPF